MCVIIVFIAIDFSSLKMPLKKQVLQKNSSVYVRNRINKLKVLFQLYKKRHSLLSVRYQQPVQSVSAVLYVNFSNGNQ